MNISRQKQEKLALIARLYYIEDWKQSDIAKRMGVSRPLISRMLSEAREEGVVEIIINDPRDDKDEILKKLLSETSLQGGSLVDDRKNDRETNLSLCREVVPLLDSLNSRRIGIGWGHFIGQLVNLMEEEPPDRSFITNVCPLLGNASVPVKNYQTNENVRILADALGARAYFFNLPALANNREEKDILCTTEIYHREEIEWELMDTALVNIGNYPATPDFASFERCGLSLQEEKACGRFLAYFFNEDGKVIESDSDFAIQIPLKRLTSCKNVVGLCSAGTDLKALKGALKTGYFTHIIARKDLAARFVDEEIDFA